MNLIKEKQQLERRLRKLDEAISITSSIDIVLNSSSENLTIRIGDLELRHKQQPEDKRLQNKDQLKGNELHEEIFREVQKVIVEKFEEKLKEINKEL